MSERPDGRDLLIVARAELLKDLLPALPAGLRYQALMVANAMAIATREMASGPEAARHELSGLRQLLGVADESRAQQPGLDAALHSARKALGTAIRAGKFDPVTPNHRAMLQHLQSTARDKLAISNPKLLPPLSH